ncbi:MAG: SDR family oxidoreductase [Lentisphaerae bacterium]|nr:SDR family oxidoreductase [Lentisphaerota bacterium]
MSVAIDLKGKNAIVFGIANDKSIAWHIAKRLDDAGCRIAAAYQERVEPSFMPLMKELHSPVYARCDVVNDELLDAFFNKVREEFGQVDFLVHSIAFAKKEYLHGKYMNIDRRGYQVALEVSAYSLAELAKRTAPMMRDDGSIIAMSDLGERRIRVNAISAGPIATLAASGVANFEQMLLDSVAKAPLKRNITAGEVADCALFLCSDLSKAIKGQVIYVDAGCGITGG